VDENIVVFEIEKPRIFHATRQQGTMIIETIRIIDTGLPGPFDQAHIIKAIDPFTSPKDRWMRRIEMLRELAYFVESDLLPLVGDTNEEVPPAVCDQEG
jgi:hypothetical protein